MTTKIIGKRQLRRALRRLPDRVTESARMQIAASALDLASLMRELVPVDTGNLRASIDAEAERGGLGWLVGTRSPLAHLQEFGTVHHGAQPFVGPAWRLMRRSIVRDIRRQVNRALKIK